MHTFSCNILFYKLSIRVDNYEESAWDIIDP